LYIYKICVFFEETIRLFTFGLQFICPFLHYGKNLLEKKNKLIPFFTNTDSNQNPFFDFWTFLKNKKSAWIFFKVSASVSKVFSICGRSTIL
jgi:hypothetical protein